MGKTFVRIPFNRGLEFPPECPFSGRPVASKSVFLWYPRWRFRIPVPVLEWFWHEPTSRFRLPASAWVANTDRALRLALVVMWLAIAVMIFKADIYRPRGAPQAQSRPPADHTTERSKAWVWLLPAGYGLSALIKALRLANLRTVEIVAADGMSVELCFRREDFAKAFAERNHFVCKPESFRERSRRVANVPG